MRYDGWLCDVDQHILALIVCGFGWHTRTFVFAPCNCPYQAWFALLAGQILAFILVLPQVCFHSQAHLFLYTLAAHVTSNHETCHVQSEWEETLCLDVGAAAQRHPRHHQVAERRRWIWSSSPRSLWLWLPLSAVFARHTLVAFQCFCGRALMFCHNHEAITTPSPLPGQAALRGESGCSLRKALPGPNSTAPSTSSSSRWAGVAAYLSSQVRASHAG